eukprot:CAMPEP_0206146992 /NCGR_PEP_ID=MMETSP1473-20131121/32088_1 /ASSEMBLY_ACC=CAM_ASM_001109 /TAXON_ID=1461547 /ORGANISM="Stichococcus sp, Strain RCC1054" /LENGTH=37 /DNA_ID= /DNA_START= /DNA_END= /DNA_ORIENTATION=
MPWTSLFAVREDVEHVHVPRRVTPDGVQSVMTAGALL